MGMIWAICSGSGGVGKTTLSLALAACVAQRGKKVILLDAAGTSRACDLGLGLENIVSLDASDVLSCQVDMKSALYPVKKYGDMYLATASLCSEYSLNELSGVILALQSMCDVLILDLPTGQTVDSMGIMTRHDSCLFVVRPDDACIRSTEHLMNRVRAQEANRMVVLNHVRKESIKRGSQYTAEAVAMTLDCVVAGIIPENEQLALCGAKHKTAFEADGAIRHPIRDVVSALLDTF